jgi:hypothetical protein
VPNVHFPELDPLVVKSVSAAGRSIDIDCSQNAKSGLSKAFRKTSSPAEHIDCAWFFHYQVVMPDDNSLCELDLVYIANAKAY